MTPISADWIWPLVLFCAGGIAGVLGTLYVQEWFDQHPWIARPHLTKTERLWQTVPKGALMSNPRVDLWYEYLRAKERLEKTKARGRR